MEKRRGEEAPVLVATQETLNLGGSQAFNVPFVTISVSPNGQLVRQHGTNLGIDLCKASGLDKGERVCFGKQQNRNKKETKKISGKGAKRILKKYKMKNE